MLETTITTTAPGTSDHLTLLVVGDGVLATAALPHVGSVLIGRAPECDVRIDDASISRNHAVLHLDPLRITDSGSANGTWVRDQRIAPERPFEIALNEAIRLGSVTVIVQRRSSRVTAAPRRMRSHDYFESRLEDECTRSRRQDLRFAIVHVVGDDVVVLFDAITEQLREDDLVAAYAPDELVVLLVERSIEDGMATVRAIEDALARRGVGARLGAAWYPRDGRDPSSLAEHARNRARGQVVAIESGDVVVADERMAALHALVGRVAKADISVLLQGETGVGKEVIAELIHRKSARADKPFLRLNCAAFTETLLESELFGYERGAFTGAVAAKPGLLEIADGGVVFLDEVGELSAAMQAKLLRVLDERKLTRVGGLAPRPIDVRIVSATNRDLEAEVARGAFRLDLLYRLNAMAIVIPALRERPAEIEPLVRKFARTIAAKSGLPAPRFSDAALALLRAYAWPGNVRELRNVIERAMVLATGDVIDVVDLPHVKLQTLAPTTAMQLEPEPPGAADERAQILNALEICHGNQTHAAKLLSISRRTLINKLEKFALPRPRKRHADPSG